MRHIEVTHVSPLSFKCHTCSKGFNQKDNMDLHVRTVHRLSDEGKSGNPSRTANAESPGSYDHVYHIAGLALLYLTLFCFVFLVN